jgi:hypothetical protein
VFCLFGDWLKLAPRLTTRGKAALNPVSFGQHIGHLHFKFFGASGLKSPKIFAQGYANSRRNPYFFAPAYQWYSRRFKWHFLIPFIYMDILSDVAFSSLWNRNSILDRPAVLLDFAIFFNYSG